jgi:hypothetical protein
MIFALIPFSAQKAPDISISGMVRRKKNIFSVHYIITGDLGEIVFPLPTENTTRKDDLWRRTGFEFFLAAKGSPQYWEFNLSPSGDWNVYAMDAYRQVNMREETRIQRLQFNVQKKVERFSLEADIDLNQIIPEDILIEAGITSVIQTKDGKESFWALIHSHPEADFHLRNSFILEFP